MQAQDRAESSKASPLDQLTKPLMDFARVPSALQWGINLPYFIEGIVYFGILTVLVLFLSENVGLGDVVSGWVVSARLLISATVASSKRGR